VVYDALKFFDDSESAFSGAGCADRINRVNAMSLEAHGVPRALGRHERIGDYASI
jgi:hypothetical protein